MDSIFFLLALIGIVVVVVWSVRNDRIPMNGRTRGLLAMRDAEEPENLTGSTPTRRRGRRPV